MFNFTNPFFRKNRNCLALKDHKDFWISKVEYWKYFGIFNFSTDFLPTNFSILSCRDFNSRICFFPLGYILNRQCFRLFPLLLPALESWGLWALDSIEMFTSCLCRIRGRGLASPSGPTPMEQEMEVEVDRGLLLVSRPVTASPVVWASPAFLFRLVLSLALLVFPCPAVAARVSSSLSTTHHVHHFHNKHGTVPIAINRMPFLTRGGHGKTLFYTFLCPSLKFWSMVDMSNNVM